MTRGKHNASSDRMLRRQLFVAPKAQGYLLFRVMLYCALSSLVTGCFYHAADLLRDSTPRFFVWWGPVFLALNLTVPLVLYDAARASNRLVGPFARIHGAIRRLANHDPVSPLECRVDDTWAEWIQDFNIMLTRVQARDDTTDSMGMQDQTTKQASRPLYGTRASDDGDSP